MNEICIEEDVIYEDVLDNLMHELRSINRVIKYNSSELNRLLNLDNVSKSKLLKYSAEILDNSQIISLWLDLTDLEINPDIISKQIKENLSIHGAFHKTALTFNRIGKNREIFVKLTGQSRTRLDLPPIVQTLPYLLLDNAVKYSPSNSSVEVHFIENSTSIRITIDSLGPVLVGNEKDSIFINGIRGKYAKSYCSQGEGKGLAIAKNICDITDAELFINAGSERFSLEGCPFGRFSVTLIFSK